MKEKWQNLKTEEQVVAFFLFVIFITLAFVFCTHYIAKSIKKPELTAPQKSSYELKELFSDRNPDQSLIKVTIKDSDNPAFRTEPFITEETRIGTMKANQQFYVERVFEASTENGRTWIGIQTEDVSKTNHKQEQIVNDKDGIVWISSDYTIVNLIDHNPGDYDRMNIDYYVRYSNDNFQIVVSDCALRSAPDSTSSWNIYGRFKTTSYIYTDVVYENDLNTFCGVPAKCIEGKYLEDRLGDVESDPDGIVWFSTQYVDEITVN